ncbi:PAS domain S-box protein [Hoyosella rhizosphaerae]|uniref:histidine kinase n=1 Tax=Hoyosella rhizosphaerae TaxID=1755582 RepID=A0A916UE32_9ACTN|nr:ATP-binding protein [Hoyosella rhizosphaerae]MBN4925833.1 PAS domain S-box protein [Hoyosella rhizosphaerae]GGC67596.1 hypothetical protein GCM10011410_20370 [Hoyosella rhizosphaerae]
MEQLNSVDEAQRLAEVARLGLGTSEKDSRFDPVTRLASRIFDYDFAAIGIITANGVRVASAQGADLDYVDHDSSITSLIVRANTIVTSTDARNDPRFADMEHVLHHDVRALIGAPIRSRRGITIGALVVADTAPHVASTRDSLLLSDLIDILDNSISAIDAEVTHHVLVETRTLETTILDSISDALLVVNSSGAVIQSNGAADKLIGTHLYGKPISDILTEDLRNSLARQIVQKRTISEFSYRGSGKVIQDSGKKIPVELSATGYPHGSSHQMVLTLRDITDRMRAEQAAEAALLAHRSAHADLLRTNAQQTGLVSVISHEFRTALTGMLAFSELIRDNDLTVEEVKDFANDIHTDAQRLSRMCNEILNASTLEATKAPLAAAEIDLANLVRMIVSRRQRAHTNYTFHIAGPTHITITADADKLTQALDNLLDNAIKYSPPRSAITLTLESSDIDATIAVTDQGFGLDDSDQKLVFERYWRSEKNTDRGINGTGLGLAIVRTIVELHHGTISVRSAPRKGTTFTIRLPRCNDKALAPPQAAAR